MHSLLQGHLPANRSRTEPITRPLHDSTTINFADDLTLACVKICANESILKLLKTGKQDESLMFTINGQDKHFTIANVSHLNAVL